MKRVIARQSTAASWCSSATRRSVTSKLEPRKRKVARLRAMRTDPAKTHRTSPGGLNERGSAFKGVPVA